MTGLTSTRIDGGVDEGFGLVADSFVAALGNGADVTGASCCVVVDGRVVVDVAGGVADPTSGRAFARDSLQLLGPASCGAVSLVSAVLVERGALQLDEPVAAYWPEFAAAGKDRVTIRSVLHHQAGLPAIDQPLTRGDLIALSPVVDALVRKSPMW